MIPLPGYAAIVDKDEADKARANARELGVEENVTVEYARVLVIGAAQDRFLCIRSDGKSGWFDRARVTFEVRRGPDWIAFPVQG